MKKILYILAVIALFTSCQKADHNGDLGGFWKLQQIELAEDGSVISKKQENRFWAVQLDLIKIGDGKGRFQHVGNALYVQMITKITSPNDYGIFNPEDERFGIIQLDRDRMILRSKNATLTFSKF